MAPERFKAAFTGAEGWGSVSIEGPRLELAVQWGRLRVRTLALATGTSRTVAVTVAGQPVSCRHEWREGRLLVTLDQDAVVGAGQKLVVAGA